MKRPDTAALLTHTGNNFNGEFTNTILIRRRRNGLFTMWILAADLDGSQTANWHKNLKHPKQFADAFKDCVEFLDFGEATLSALYTDGLPILKKLDPTFTLKLATYLEEEPEIQEALSERLGSTSPAPATIIRYLSASDIDRIGGPYFRFGGTYALREGQKPSSTEQPPKPTMKESMAKAASHLMLLPDKLIAPKKARKPKDSKNSKKP
jgi:hypothetical protein